MSWLEISLTLEDVELAEAVAEVMGRHLPDGVFIQATGVVYDPDSEGRAIGPYRVCGYIPQDGELKATRQKIEEGLWYLGRIRPLPEPEFNDIQETNWVDTWKQHYHPIPVGEKLVILPPWETNPRPGTIPILIDPGMAFGTGTHPTTQLTLQLMEQALAQRPSASLLDIGCGSGILSIAGVKLGAVGVIGVDLDDDAIDNAWANARLNGAEQDVLFAIGSVAELLAGGFPLRQADVVVANILAHVLIQLLDEGLARLVTPGGELILSGILDEREADLLDAVERHGLSVVKRIQMGDWVAIRAAQGSGSDQDQVRENDRVQPPVPVKKKL